MRPISLIISGLNSFRQEQFIDFSLVSDTGTFGIFGPTGSGKSTILDAITLSLYGKVERSDNNRVGILNQQEDKLHVKFVFELSTISSSQRYYVQRVYKRNDEQRVKSSLARLVKVNDEKEEVLADKETDVTKQVEELIGLNVEDFTRAVVLPQGKFAEFLTLKSKDRRPMLERLFNLDQYGKKLKSRVQDRENLLKKARDELIAQQEVLAEANKENINLTKKELDIVIKMKDETEKELEAFLNEFKEIEKIWTVQKDLIDIRNQFEKLVKNEEQINSLRVNKENAEKAAIVAPTFKQYREIEQQIDKLSKNLKEMEENKRQLLQEVKQLEEAKNEKKKAYEENYQINIDKKYKLKEALELEKDIEALEKAITEYEGNIEKIQPERDKTDSESKSLAKEKDELLKSITTLKDKLVELNISNKDRKKLELAITASNNLLQKKKELEGKEEEEIKLLKDITKLDEKANKQKTSYETTDERYNKLELDIKELEENKPLTNDEWYAKDKAIVEREQKLFKLEELSKELERVETEKKENNLRVENISKDIKYIEKEITKLEDKITKKKDELKTLENKEKVNVAVKLALELKESQPCIVCGSLHHPTPKTEQDLDTAVIEEINFIKEEIANQEQELTTNKVNLKGLESNYLLYNEQSEKLTESINKLTELSNEIISTLPKKYVNLNLEEIKIKVNKDKNNNIQLKEEMISWNNKYEECKENLINLKEKRNGEIQEYKLTVSEINILNNRKKELEESIAILKKEVKELESDWLLVKSDWEFDTVEDSKQRMELMDGEREKLQKELNSLEEENKQLEKVENHLKEKLQISNNQLAEINTEMKKDKLSLDKFQARYNSLTDGKSAKDELDRVDKVLEKLVNELAESEKLLEEKTNELNQLTSKFQSEEAVLENAETNKRKTLEQLNNLMEEYKIVNYEAIEQNYLTAGEIEDLGKEIKDYDDSKAILANKEKDYLKKLNGTEITEENWEEHLERKKHLEGKLEEDKNEVAKIKYHYDQLQKDYDRWLKLDKKRQEVQNDLDITSELNQVLRGNSLVDFIAQEYLLNITVIASEKLRKLTRNRYSLEVDTDGGFNLIDELNGGLSRSVSTLSGGETFLTSLALALALSSQIQLKGGNILEFFFLDEGFGSLDNDLLDTVMMTLEKLHAGHMTIGVISHVPEMQSRINRRIIVKPADSLGNGSQVSIEYN